ncbi:abscisic acid receptor PYL4-like [Amaranthus tricolor]|uniref:abscisic acid receptor PYL4-like n=1 Tax=Amaranthus tricolor TaxID=29722 RepID=UPI00258B2DE5|nr:abscisic acid receptor PYL4-like [Amaranthus tricolor]
MPKSSVLLRRITTNTHPTTTYPFSHLHHKPPPSLPPLSTPDFKVPDDVVRYHAQTVNSDQCSSAVVQEISAPVSTVWSVVRRFDAPQVYKHFVRSCDVISGDGDVGTLRRVRVVSGLPAATSDERLEILDDDRHVISFSIVGGDHRLSNYKSVTSLHRAVGDDGEESTVVVESYVVDTPADNSKEETCVFVDTIVRCNLQSLAQIAENLANNKEPEKNDKNHTSGS